MNIKKLENGKYQVDGRPQGKSGKRVIRTFNQRREAVAFVQYLHKQVQDRKPWQGNAHDKRSLAELAETWHRMHGQTLKDGHKRVGILRELSQRLNTPAEKITPAMYTEDRNRRLESGTSPLTLNNELAYIKAVYNKLNRLDEIKYPNPLAKVEKIKTDEKEMSYLEHEAIDTLLAESLKSPNKHLPLIIQVCLSTGARWSEAEALQPSNLTGKNITFGGTKSGKTRTVPISQELADKLRTHFAEHGRFSSAYDAFRSCIERTGIMLPKGQSTHVLRHTFASHFMMNGGNILVLQKILGHSTLTMTMRYAHLSPDHLQEAVELNPLASREKVERKWKASHQAKTRKTQ